MTAPPVAADAPARLAHIPALDGLRGVAVAGVVVFHGALTRDGELLLPGGYLGVSAFFTLSGFLITTLLLREHAATGAIDRVGFWTRRARRLLPAALAGVLLAAVVVVAAGDAATLDRFPLDALAAVGNVANWRFVVSELSYAELFSDPSPLQHYWSLAIEEQCYLVLPLAVAALARGAGGRLGRRVGLAAGFGIAASVAASLVVDGDRAYYGTDTRAAELLVGVALAAAVHAGLHERIALGVRRAGGVVALAAMAFAWATVAQDDPSLHPWVLLGHAAATAVLIVSVLSPGPATTLLAARPLVAVGAVSYGVYVFHWPLFGLLDAERTGTDGVTLFGLRLLVTAALAVTSYRLLEQPVRTRRLPRPGPRAVRVAMGSVAVTAVVSAAVALIDREPAVDFAAAAEVADALAADVPEPTTPAPTAPDDAATTTTVPAVAERLPVPDPARMALFGDSTAFVLLPAFVDVAAGRPDVVAVAGAAFDGCGLIRGGTVRRTSGDLVPVEPGCDFSTAWLEAIQLHRPDIAVVQVGLWDLVDRRLSDDDGVRTIGDPIYDAVLRSELETLVDLWAPELTRVVFVLQPPPVRTSRSPTDDVFDRLPRFNEALVRVYGDDPRVGLVDLDAWIRSRGELESIDVRPDGTHFGTESAPEAVAFLVAAALEAAARPTTIIGPEDLPAGTEPASTTDRDDAPDGEGASNPDGEPEGAGASRSTSSTAAADESSSPGRTSSAGPDEP